MRIDTGADEMTDPTTEIVDEAAHESDLSASASPRLAKVSSQPGHPALVATDSAGEGRGALRPLRPASDSNTNHTWEDLDMCRAKLSTLGRILTASMLAAVVTLGAPRADAAPEPFLGEIMFVGFQFCPNGWLPADGRSMNISPNAALFSLLGTTYGGDGITTFQLPDLRGQIVDPGKGPDRKVRITTCIAVNGVYPSRP